MTKVTYLAHKRSAQAGKADADNGCPLSKACARRFANDIICWGSLIVISNRFLRTSQQLQHDYEHGLLSSSCICLYRGFADIQLVQ